MSVDVKYSTEATATGGRDGRSKTHDGALDVKLGTPKELGGSGDGNNPEQLFATGYAACFLGALKAAGRQEKVKVPDNATVTAKVGIGPRPEGGFGITADLTVTIPDMDRAQAEALLEKAHFICPYSHATRGNIAVSTQLA